MSLYQHQREAIEFAIRNNGSCALFHDPGLGKTRTCLEVFSYYRILEPNLKLLVVCPLSLINAAWGEDIQKFTSFTYTPFKELKAIVPDIVVINYEALISPRNLPAIQRLINAHEFMCVLDESSRLKNNRSVTTKTLLNLTERFKYRIVSSGTPMPNSELELWGQINFIQPSVLHSSFYKFRNTFFHLERGGRIMNMNGQFLTKDEMRKYLSSGWRYAISPENRQVLMEEIKPFTHWVRKEEALDLPDKVDEIREVILNARERKAYNEMRDHLVTEIEGEEVSVQVALAKLMKLRQATAGFFYAEDGGALEIGNASKLKELDEVLEELGDQPVIVWVQFHHEVDVVTRLIIEKYGINSVATLYSETRNRESSISKFKNGEVRYLVAHPKSAGHGLTFTNCSTMVFYSLDYSYEAHTQARDRIHRIGQTQSCLYIYLIAKDSIDEQLLGVLQRKKGLQDVVHEIIGSATKKQRHSIHKI